MKSLKILRKLSVALATIGLLVPNTGTALGKEVQTSLSAMSTPANAKITDIALTDGGMLRGQVVNANGVAQANSQVAIFHGKDAVASTSTNQQGEFVVTGVKGGTYVVATNGAAGVVRAWAPRTAPPSAVPGLLLVPEEQAVRANLQDFIAQYGVASLVVGGFLVGVAFVAIDHNDDAS